MSPFWASLFTHLRGCGRNATLFMIALAGVFLLLPLGAMACASGLHRYVLPALPWVGLAVVVWGVVWFRRALTRRRDRLQAQPLSDNELRVARSKLLRSRR